MLTEKGLDIVSKLLSILKVKKEVLPTKSFEIQKIVNKLKNSNKPIIYNPIDLNKKTNKVTSEVRFRQRGFRLAVLEEYDYRCAFCGMKIHSPDTLIWEVEAAHIVPHRLKGKDYIWNAMALCHLHHWAFDVGWFTLLDDYVIRISSKINVLPLNLGKFGEIHFLTGFTAGRSKIYLPLKEEIYPHKNSLN
jgi:predicted restriction endonuclease